MRGFVSTRSAGAGKAELVYVTGDTTSTITKRLDDTTLGTHDVTWSASLPVGVTASGVSLTSTQVTVGGSDGILYTVDRAAGGAPVAWKNVGGGKLGTPSTDATLGRIYAGTEQGMVVAYPLP